MRSATQLYCNTVEYGCVSLRMRFFPQNFGTMKRILPGSSSPSHREGPGIEVDSGPARKTVFIVKRPFLKHAPFTRQLSKMNQ